MLRRASTGAMWSLWTTRTAWTFWRVAPPTRSWPCSPSSTRPAACPERRTRCSAAPFPGRKPSAAALTYGGQLCRLARSFPVMQANVARILLDVAARVPSGSFS